MGKMFNVNIVNRDTFDFLPQNMKNAVRNSINVIGRSANKKISVDMKQVYNIPSRVTKIGNNIRLRPARRNEFVFKISIRSSPRGTFKFPHRQTARGVEVEIKRGKRQLIKGAFVAPLRKDQSVGRKGTFRRRAEKNNTFVFVRSKSRGHITRFTKKGTPYSAERRRTLVSFDIQNVYNSKFGFGRINKIIKDNFQKTLDQKFLDQVIK